MAKSLEEHLYRSAQTKEEYMDFGTLRRRLQAIAHGLELHRPSSSASQQSGDQSNQTKPMPSGRSQGRSSFQTSNNNDNTIYSSSIQSTQDPMNTSMNSAMGIAPINQSQLPSHMHPLGGQMNHSTSFSSSMGANSSAPPMMGNLQQRQTSSQFQTNSSWPNSGSAEYGSSMGADANLTTMPLNAGVLPMGGMSLSQQQQMQPSMIQQQQPMSSMMSGPSQMGDTGGQTLNSAQIYSQNWNTQSSQFWDTTGASGGMDSSMQKKKVILQQQQRLLLLRHASKCTAGAACQTRFCSQMVTLWRHMKACRDKNCKTPHCVSSRCVLNHYRICKSNGKTASCEVCGPVMMKINQKDTDAMTNDPLTRDQDSMKQSHSPYQQHSMQQGVGQMSTGLMNQNIMQPLPVQQQSSMQPVAPQNLVNSAPEGVQLQQVKQQQQLKLKQQLENLKQLQKKQEELEKQQKQLEMHGRQIQDPNSPQAQQLQQQQMLLRHLQKKCQQQQLMLQQEVKMLMTGSGNQQLDQNQMTAQAQFQQQQFQQQLITQQQGLQGSMSLAPGNVQGVQPSGSIVEGHNQGTLSRKSPVPAKQRYSGGKGRRGGKGKTLGINPPVSKKRPSEADDDSPQYSKRAATTKTESIPSETSSGERTPSLGSGLDETSLIPLMSRDEIMKHLESLNKRFCLSSRTVTHKCLPIIQTLIDDQFGWVFHDPVDPVTLGLPDYFDVVKTPMCLELVKKKLENAIYNDTESFARDTCLVFENAILYNGESSEVGELAKSMLDKFHLAYRALIQGKNMCGGSFIIKQTSSVPFLELESSHLNLEKKGELCSLCGNQNRKFEPTVLYCQGDCKMQEIKRHATYYTDRAKQNFWCQGCFHHLAEDQPIMLDDGTEVRKIELQECKNDALPEEGWVNCDHCNSWVHQICSLFNGRVNKTGARYTCPNCYLSKGSIGRAFSKQIKVAADLPHCKMSEAIENGVLAALEKAYKDRSDELGLSVDDVEKADSLSIRVVSNTEKRHFVGEEVRLTCLRSTFNNGVNLSFLLLQMLRRYKDEGCAKDYPVRTKCIALFQKIHGADTLLFAMYVYEYGHDSPAPNRRRVYVSYLDSVQYFEPKCYRTLVYHTVLVEYLRYVKARGFHTAHIWSCPPTPGDDYIFHIHPAHQLIPREDMLRAWYHGMLDRAKAEGIVIRTTTLYDEYFVEGGVDSVPWATGRPTCLPYFEGDYIPGEIETIIKTEREKETPIPESNAKDTVMTRLGFNLRQMKDNFIVVHLRSRRFAAAVESGDDVTEFKDDSDDEIVRSKRAKISGKDTGLLHTRNDLFEQAGSIVKEEPSADAMAKDDFLAVSTGEEQTLQVSEAQLADDNNILEKDSGSTANVTATERMHSPLSETKVDVDDDIKPVQEKFSSPTENGDVAPSGGNVQEKTEEATHVDEQPVKTTIFVKEDDTESKTIVVATVEKVDEIVELGIKSNTEALSVDCNVPSQRVTTDIEQSLGIQPVTDNNILDQASSQTNQDDPINRVLVDDNKQEKGETKAVDCNFETTTESGTFDEEKVDNSNNEGSDSNKVVVKPELTEVKVAIETGPQESNDESIKGFPLSKSGTKQFENDSVDGEASPDLANENVAVENDATGGSSIEGVDRVAADANPSAGDNDVSHACCDETQETLKSRGNVVGGNQDESIACEGDTVTTISAGETVSATNQVEADENGQTSFTNAAVQGAAPEQVILPASVREVNSSSSEVSNKEQISCVETMKIDEQPPNQIEEESPKDSVVTDKLLEAADTKPSSTANSEAHLSSNREHPTAPSDILAVEEEKNPDIAYSKEQVSSFDAVDKISIDPSLSVEDSQRLAKRGIEEIKPLLSRHFEGVNSSPKYVTDTVDPDEPIEVELFESRQRFLNYCQSSHCQFDELRRAKHSTMMVLFQLHNPAAPLFLQQCGACYRDITHGVRYSCNNCSKFDLCEDCYKPVTSGLWAKRDSRFEHDLSHTFTPIDMEVSIDTAMSQEDRQKALKAHCALLEHAGGCQGAPACSLQNCQKMKKLFNHVRSCDIKPKTDCRICTRLISLCAIHARTCEVADSCPVPFCDRIRDRNERLHRQQQLMDDRRRQAQNELYHTS